MSDTSNNDPNDRLLIQHVVNTIATFSENYSIRANIYLTHSTHN